MNLAVLDRLSHRYPSILVDGILMHDPGARMVAVKKVTVNEEFFQGHFPNFPVMPGVLVIEAMAQVGCVLAYKSAETTMDLSNKLVYFAGIDNARFRKPVLPGDQIRFEVVLLRSKGTFWKMKGVATVDGETACDAEIMAMLGDK